MTLLPYNPVVTSSSVDSPGNYEYGPSVVGKRLWACTGLNTDAITSVLLDGTKASKPFTYPNKLVADPCAIRTSLGYTVFFTMGEPDGKRNGVASYKADLAGNYIANSVRIVVPQSLNPATYGNGQPGYCVLGDGNPVLWHRADSSVGNVVRAYVLRNNQLFQELNFVDAAGNVVWEDGVSPEIFWYDNRIQMLVLGAGYAALRSYTVQSGYRLFRERFRETNVGGLWGRNHVPVKDMIDGAGVVRGSDNKAIIVGGKIEFWRGAGDPNVPGTWRVVKGYISL